MGVIIPDRKRYEKTTLCTVLNLYKLTLVLLLFYFLSAKRRDKSLEMEELARRHTVGRQQSRIQTCVRLLHTPALHSSSKGAASVYLRPSQAQGHHILTSVLTATAAQARGGPTSQSQPSPAWIYPILFPSPTPLDF